MREGKKIIIGRDESLKQFQERVADALLKMHGASKDKDFPAYSEAYLAAQSRKHGELSLEEVVDKYSAYPKSMDDLCEVPWAEIWKGANATKLELRQRDVLELRSEGLSMDEIAKLVGCSKRTVYRDMVIIAKKIQCHPWFAVVCTLAEVFHLDFRIMKIILRSK
jgi:DNA-binding NarL/FixJ family response regulator